LNDYTGDQYNPSIQCTAGYTSLAGSSKYGNCTSRCDGVTFWNGTSCAQKHSFQYWCGGMTESPADHLCSNEAGTNRINCVNACKDKFDDGASYFLRPNGVDESKCADTSGNVENWCRAKPESFTFTPATNCEQSTTEAITSPCKCAASSTTNECLIGKYCYDGGCENAAKGTPTTSTQCSNIDASVFQRLSAKTCSE